jgi:hypothetical protein
MFNYMVETFVSYFRNLSVIGIVLAVIFGALWLVCYRPPVIKQYWLWAVMVGSAILTLIAIVFIQIPFQTWTIKGLANVWGEATILKWALLAGLPNIIYIGLVQEGAKLVPAVIYWRQTGKTLSPAMMIAVGAVAGAGYGILETQWSLNSVMAEGWTWELVTTNGVLALGGFWEGFFMTAFHIGVSALAAYGLSKGKAVHFFLLAALAHIVLQYSVLLVQMGLMSFQWAAFYIAAVAIAVAGVTLWLRWRKQDIPVKKKKSGKATR